MIREVIEKIIDQKIVLTIQSGIVTEVEGDTCTVEADYKEATYFKVSINAIQENGSDQLMLSPSINSKVVFGVYPNGKNATLLSVSELDSMYYKKSDTEFLINDQGFEIKRQGESLTKVLNDYIDEVNKIVVVNGTSINVGATTAIKGRLNKILQ